MLIEVSREQSVDLIVLGNRDRTNQKSISNYLIRPPFCSSDTCWQRHYGDYFISSYSYLNLEITFSLYFVGMVEPLSRNYSYKVYIYV